MTVVLKGRSKKKVNLIVILLQEKYLTPDWILHFKSTLHSAPVLMVDANLSHPSLEASCRSTFTLLILSLVSLWRIINSLTNVITSLCINIYIPQWRLTQSVLSGLSQCQLLNPEESVLL